MSLSNEDRISFSMMQLYGAVENGNWKMAGVYLRVLQAALAKGKLEQLTHRLQGELLNAEGGKDAPYLHDALRELDAAVTKLVDPSPVRRAMASWAQ